MVENVLLDVDGTLVDSVDAHARAWQRSLAHFRVDVPYEKVRSQIGKGADQLIPALVPRTRLAEIEKPLEKHRSALFKKEYLAGITGFPRTRELVEHWMSQGKRIILASSAKGDELAHYKEAAGVADLIDDETSADSVEHSKPCPDIFEAALVKLGNPQPNLCVVIGDSPYDAIAARRAHIRTIGLLCGGFSADELWRAGVVALYRNPSELLDALINQGDGVLEAGIAQIEAEESAIP